MGALVGGTARPPPGPALSGTGCKYFSSLSLNSFKVETALKPFQFLSGSRDPTVTLFLIL